LSDSVRLRFMHLCSFSFFSVLVKIDETCFSLSAGRSVGLDLSEHILDDEGDTDAKSKAQGIKSRLKSLFQRHAYSIWALGRYHVCLLLY
jgi:hypothetical protein